ncbi:MAG: PEP-CTERM sorting domain-containing protein [Chthoniobacterales bacterium]
MNFSPSLFNKGPALLFSLILGASIPAVLQAQDQTSSFSPVTNWSENYGISLQLHDMGGVSVPTLQSFASASYNDQWVLIAGRTNGLHGFSNSGTTNFPPAYQNSTVWVIDPVTKQTWSRSLSDPSSGLSTAVVDSLSASNTQHYSSGDTLFVAGGYVYDSALDDFTTYNALTAIDLPDLVSWAKADSPTLAANSVIQIAGAPFTNGSHTSGYFAVTGGEMFQTSNGKTHLVFGQNFEGPYTAGANGDYTSQVRSFTVDYNKAGGTLAYTPNSATPNPGDETQFRRRDLTVAPSITPDAGSPSGYKEGMIAYAGVFYEGSGVWTLPVEIDVHGNPVMVGSATDPGAFKQAMNHYAAANVGMYSEATGDFTSFQFGGISANTYNPDTGVLTYDSGYPFTSQITAVTRHADGTYEQFYLGEYPLVTDGAGHDLLYGAEAEFFVNMNLPMYANGVINFDALGSGDILLGYIYGGIASTLPNTSSPSDSMASNDIFAVYYHNPIPEPSSIALVLMSGFAIFSYRKRKKAC